MKKIAAFLGIGFVVGVIYCLCSIIANQNPGPFAPPEGTVLLRVAKETTVVTEPLLPDGKAVDFLAVLDQLCSVNADSEENGFREVMRQVGRSVWPGVTREKWKILCEKLNLAPDTPPRFQYLSFRDFISDTLEKSAGQAPQFDADGLRLFESSTWQQAGDLYFAFSLRKGDISPEELELLERWAKEMEPAIDAVAEALKKPLHILPPAGRLELPVTLDLPNDWPDFIYSVTVHREVIQMFTFRFQYRLAKQDLKTWDDVLSMFHVARHVAQQSWPESASFGNAFEKMAAYYAAEFLKIKGLETETLRRCLADLEALPKRTTFEDRLEYTRLGWLKNISEFPQKGPMAFKHRLIDTDQQMFTEEQKKMIQQANAGNEKIIRIYREVPFDWNIVAEIMNAEFDERQGKPTRQTLFQSNPSLRKIYEETKVRVFSFEETLEILKGGMDMFKIEGKIEADEIWDINRLKKMSLEERSVYLGKAVFAPHATLMQPEYFAYESQEGTEAVEAVKNEIDTLLKAVE